MSTTKTKFMRSLWSSWSLKKSLENGLEKQFKKKFNDIGVNVTECRGKCSGGTTNMHSQKKGAASLVLKESPTAIATHSCSHNLNLSLAALSKLAQADNILETYKAIINSFNTSPKREGLLE